MGRQQLKTRTCRQEDAAHSSVEPRCRVAPCTSPAMLDVVCLTDVLKPTIDQPHAKRGDTMSHASTAVYPTVKFPEFVALQPLTRLVNEQWRSPHLVYTHRSSQCPR